MTDADRPAGSEARVDGPAGGARDTARPTARDARRRVRRILALTVVLPLAVAITVAVLRLGTAHRRIAEIDDVAVAQRILERFYAERARSAVDASDSPGTAGVRGPGPDAKPDTAAPATDTSPDSTALAAGTHADGWLHTLAAGYDAALYADGRRIAATDPAFAPDAITAALRDSVASFDRPFPTVLPTGRRGAIAPVKDRDRWDVVGALLVAPTTPAPSRVPGRPFAAGLVTLLLTLAAAVGCVRTSFAPRPTPRRTWLRRGLTVLLFVPAANYAAFLYDIGGDLPVAEVAGEYRLWLAIAFGAWGVLAAVGVSLARTAARPIRLREALAAWGFLAPSFLHLLLFSIGPIAFALFLSFHEWNLVESARPFVGLDNYRALLDDAPFWRSVLNTAVYVLFVPIAMVAALALALLVNRRFRGVRFLRTALFLPYITSFVAISLVWKWMYQPDFGLFNTALRALGLPESSWLTSPSTALPSLMLMSIWMYAGYMMVIFLAGLQNIPDTLYESARIDGAGAWQRFRRITLPLLKPTTFFILVTMVIFSFQVFTAVYVMTEGGPLHATDVVVYHIYRNAWEYLRMGYASAMAWVLFAVVFVLTMIQWKWLGGRGAYE